MGCFEDAIKLQPGQWFYYSLTIQDQERLDEAATGPVHSRPERVWRAYLQIRNNLYSRLRWWKVEAKPRIIVDNGFKIIVEHKRKKEVA